MKRTYKKPFLALEPYQLDASVAAACSTENKIPIYYFDTSCTFEDGTFGASCFPNIVDGPKDGDYPCYHGMYDPLGRAFTYS